MTSLKQLKLAQKAAVHYQQLVEELDALVKDIDRCQRTIITLKEELERVNQKHANRQTTREDIDYLTDLLKCANKKLVWEKHMASLQKRTPLLLERVSKLANDPNAPADEQMRDTLVQGLQRISHAMEQLQSVK
ncbi:MAG: hypothetical protein SFY81_01065 [Verrucomicrobiota bacterium]|nr:hypothetical protein [Verrucomicrobiota bacterium]